MKILIADDEQVVRDSLGGILKKGGGYETDFAFDGAVAVKKIEGELYDAVLLDIAMPKLDGYQVLSRARKLYPNLPIVFITGRGEVKKVEASIARHHLNAFIEKPFTPDEVLDVVKRVIKKPA